MDRFDFTRCERSDGSFYGTGGTCRIGQEVGAKEVKASTRSSSGFTSEDLDAMEKSWETFKKTGKVPFAFKMPKEYDDSSGTPEAVNELISLREVIKQDIKTGRIEIPDYINVSDKARQLVDEWNSLDLSRVYSPAHVGNKLNVNGIGNAAGPRQTVPKDPVRGLIQFVALRRQEAELVDGPSGKLIDSYRNPFTGQRLPFELKVGNRIEIAASQDHWEKPFGIYGIKSENDLKNTVYMPVGMNSSKGESSPARFLYLSLVKAGRIRGDTAADRHAIGGFAARYAKDPSLDFLPKGVTRADEKKTLEETIHWMFTKANGDIDSKYVPRMKTALHKGRVSHDEAAKLLYGIAKQESRRNYFGGLLKFANGERIFTPYEAAIFKGIKLDVPTPVLKAQVKARIEKSPDPPEIILAKVVAGRSAGQPDPSPALPSNWRMSLPPMAKVQVRQRDPDRPAAQKLGGVKVGSAKRLNELSVGQLRALRNDPRLYQYQREKIDAILVNRAETVL